jgi:hypothetical protein
LYGTSNVYALEIDENLTDNQILDIIAQMPDIPESTDPQEAEDAGINDNGSVAGTQGLDPAQPLPGNVSVINDTPVKFPKMCPKSFPVNGNEMAKFPVTVNGGTPVWWKEILNTTGGQAKKYLVAVGKGWILVQKDDTWYKANPWRLFTTVPITSIVLEPLLRNTVNDPVGNKRVYAFDVGGKRPTAPTPVKDYEHTPGSARGQFIIQSDSSPKVDFTATYSDPVDIAAPGGKHVLGDYTPIPLTPQYGGPDIKPPPSRIPTHDLYGTLTINFDPAIKGTATIKGLSFAFVADTDCILPVVGASVYSNLLTLFGEGLVYVKETNQSGSYSLMPTPFEVAKDGVNTFDVSDLISNLQADHCYSLVNEGSLETNIPLEVNGEDVPGDMYCK